MFCRRSLVSILLFLVCLNDLPAEAVAGKLSRTLGVAKLNSNNAESVLPKHPLGNMRRKRIVTDTDPETAKKTVEDSMLFKVRKRKEGALAKTENTNMIVRLSGQENLHNFTDANPNYMNVINATDIDYNDDESSRATNSGNGSDIVTLSGYDVSTLAVDKNPTTTTPLATLKPPCWLYGNDTNCTRELRNPGYMSYFFSEYYTCKTTKFNNIEEGITKTEFVEPTNMNTLKHFLGFRNGILCTVRWNAVKKTVVTSVFSNRLAADYRDPYLYHLCRKLDFHLDLTRDLKRQYNPLSILDGCACAATNAVSNKIVTEALCCCLPRAFEYALTRMQEVAQLKAPPDTTEAYSAGRLSHNTYLFMSFVALMRFVFQNLF